MVNPNDHIRQQMLQYFYDRNQNATSEKGKRGSHVKISDAKSELKSKHGLTQSQVMAQLNYLISSNWVSKDSESRTFTTKTGTHQPSTVDWYAITAKGIDKIEGSSSEFMRQNPYSNVNITAVNSAIQLGNGNIVNESFVGWAKELEKLSQVIAASDLSEEEKMSAIAEIETVNGQLAKPNPSREIIKIAWGALTDSKAASLIQSASGLVKLAKDLGYYRLSSRYQAGFEIPESMTTPAKLNKFNHAEDPARRLLERLVSTYAPRAALAAERGDAREVAEMAAEGRPAASQRVAYRGAGSVPHTPRRRDEMRLPEGRVRSQPPQLSRRLAVEL